MEPSVRRDKESTGEVTKERQEPEKSNSAGALPSDSKTGETSLRCNHCPYETRILKRSKAKQMRDYIKGCKGDKTEVRVVQEDTEPRDVEQPKRLEAAVPSLPS